MRERKAGYFSDVSVVTARTTCTLCRTINLAQSPAQSLFPMCFRRYPGFPCREVTEGPGGDRGGVLFLSSMDELISVVPAGGRQSIT